MKHKRLYRRDFLKLAGLATLGTVSACVPAQPVANPQSVKPSQLENPKKRVLRIAHMTDFHVYPDNIASDGMIRALRHAQAQADPPDIILNTGDSIMESLEADKANTVAQWDVYNNIMKAECRLPVINAIGNHDVWGWAAADPNIKKDPLYGKEMALEKLGLSNRYYSFDQADWHFVVLDSTHTSDEASPYAYIGKLDDEQFQWLIEDINAVPKTTPICIISHIPILAACEYFDGPNEEGGNWKVPGAWMHIAARRFRQLFLQYPNVRLCLSGHAHQHEVLDYLGVRYMTNGAVCGNWWQGWYMDFPPAYVMVNLYTDGTADSSFIPYNKV